MPGPSIVELVVFESSFLGPVLGVLGAFGALLVLRGAGKAKLGFVLGIVLIALGAAAGLASRVVETQREVGVRLSGELVDRVFVGDSVGSEGMIADSVLVSASGQPIGSEGKRWMLNAITMVPDWMTSGSYSVEGSAVDNETTTRVLMRVRTEPNVTFGPSAWMFTWRVESDGAWRLYGLEALRFGLRDADARLLGRGRP